MEVERIFSAEQIQVHPDLSKIIREYTKAVIRENPVVRNTPLHYDLTSHLYVRLFSSRMNIFRVLVYCSLYNFTFYPTSSIPLIVTHLNSLSLSLSHLTSFSTSPTHYLNYIPYRTIVSSNIAQNIPHLKHFLTHLLPLSHSLSCPTLLGFMHLSKTNPSALFLYSLITLPLSPSLHSLYSTLILYHPLILYSPSDFPSFSVLHF